MASRKRSISNDSDVSAKYKEWDDVSCPICMDHPHNAVLLICSSHNKGCRSYICDTSYRHSNCLDRYKKLKEENADSSPPHSIPETHQNIVGPSTGRANTGTWIEDGGYNTVNGLSGANSTEYVGLPEGSGRRDLLDPVRGTDSDEQRDVLDIVGIDVEKFEEGLNLRCPLCRGSLLGWKVVEEVRKYLNLKSRSCSSESCLFVGNYRELRRHARRVHPTVRPADIDPTRQRAWRHLEDQREYNDIVSAIQSAMPGAAIFGDYVIENGDRLSVERDRGGGTGSRLLSTFFLFHMIGSMNSEGNFRGNRPRVFPRHRRAGGNNLPRRRYPWGESLLGVQNDEEEEEEEHEVNGSSDNDDGVPTNARRREREMNDDHDDNGPINPRRRRRLSRGQPNGNQQ